MSDYSYLRQGARGVQLPMPFDMAQQMLTISQAAQMRDSRAYEIAKRKRDDEIAAEEALAMPELLAGGNVADLARKYPGVAGKLAVASERMAKNKAEIDEKTAQADSHRANTRDKSLRDIGNAAFAESRNPSRDSIARVQMIADHYGVKLPFPKFNVDDPGGLKSYLETLGNASFAVADRVRNETTIRGQDLVADDQRRDREQRTSDNAADRAVTIAGQNKVDARARDANNINNGLVTKRVMDGEFKLNDDWRQTSKGFIEVASAIRKINTALDTADKNPGSSLAAGTAFMKILDPNSVVRESELALALNASGWFDRATNIAQRMVSGGIMTPLQVKNLRAAANDLYREAQKAQRDIDASFRQRAMDYGLSPERVIMRLGQDDDGSVDIGNGMRMRRVGGQ